MAIRFCNVFILQYLTINGTKTWLRTWNGLTLAYIIGCDLDGDVHLPLVSNLLFMYMVKKASICRHILNNKINCYRYSTKKLNF